MLKETGLSIKDDLIQYAKNELKEFQGKTVLNRPTGDFFYDSWTIKDDFKNTVWESILDTLTFSYGEARLIVLRPGESYMAHADIDDRYHLNIVGNNSFLIDIESQKMYPTLADGKWYEMEAGKIHVASNFGEISRVQLVIRKLLNRGQFKSSIRVVIRPSNKFQDYRYKFDNQISPWLNRMNNTNNMDNFEFIDDTVKFDLNSELVSELKNFDRNVFLITYE
jgi:hypothetical protein